MAAKIDLTGKVFGRLTVLSFNKTGKNYQRYWNCKCECGNSTIVTGGALRSLNTISCGCFKRETTSKVRTTHGGTKGIQYHPLYGVWSSMKSRCYDLRLKVFKNYGGRGIHVCEEWLTDFGEFKKWALQHGYTKGLQLDRINNNGNYEPNNCRFVTCKINCNNTRKNVLISFKGQEKTLSEWSDYLGIKYSTLRARIYTYGYPVVIAFTSNRLRLPSRLKTQTE